MAHPARPWCSENQLDPWVRCQATVNVVELFATGDAGGQGQTQVPALLTRTHVHLMGLQRPRVGLHCLDDSLSKVVTAFSHDLDGKVAGVLNQALVWWNHGVTLSGPLAEGVVRLVSQSLRLSMARPSRPADRTDSAATRSTRWISMAPSQMRN
ncbi:MAG: hypothetical protein RL446_868 [Pseudomonadota bacterium]